MTSTNYKEPKSTSSSTNKHSFTTEDHFKQTAFESEMIKLKNAYWQDICDLQNKLVEYKTQEEKITTEIEHIKTKEQESSYKSIQTIGLFTSVLALIITNINIITNTKDALTILALLTAMNCSLLIFTSIIYFYFDTTQTKKLGKSFWIPFGLLFILLLVSLATIITKDIMTFYPTKNDQFSERTFNIKDESR
jgi:uncharacterized membrane protein